MHTRIFAVLALAAACLAADPSELSIGPDGRLHLSAEGAEVCALSPFSADRNWKFAPLSRVGEPSKDGPIRFSLGVEGVEIAGEATLANQAGDGVASWTFTAPSEVNFSTIAIATDFSVATLLGGSWEIDGKQGAFPAVFSDLHFAMGESKLLKLTMADGKVITLTFPQPMNVLLQDNRKWSSPTFHIRIGRPAGKMAAQERWGMGMTVSVPGGVRCLRDMPVTLAADDDWVPLATDVEIEPGSALDLSGLGLIDGPCGAKGRVIATREGHFAYADDPGTPRRFYGVNLCFSSLYLPKEQVDRMLDRLVRMGYNTVRIHHYEYRLTSPDWKPGFDWDANRVDQLDYLIAGCAKRGLWLTTDLYVSRPVPGRQIGVGGDRPDPDRFKILIPVHEPAFQDWLTFTRKLLDHVNPYTGRRTAEEPALAWISLINEGWIQGYGIAKNQPQWTAAWNRWLAAQYPDRDALDAAVGDLTDREDPADGSVALPAELNGTRRSRLVEAFIADTLGAMTERMRRILRDELKCPALITDMNCGGKVNAFQRTRSTYDYVDDHFYVDHPVFTRNQWNLPSRCPNTNPVRDGVPGGRTSASIRIWGRPFTISEFNYSGPGRFRGVGGILTGALASIQDWDALWRFAYAHADKQLFAAAPMDYFNLANDPLNQAADRAAVLLYLRRDMRPAPGRVAVVMPRDELRRPPGRLPADPTGWLAFSTRIGCAVVDDANPVPKDAIAIPMRQAGDRAKTAALLAERRIPSGAGADGVTRSETGELAFDQKRGLLTIDTPRTAGGYAEPGLAIDAAGAGVRIDGMSIGATVFVAAVDQAPIRTSRRILVTHLTDLQNTGVQYGESARQNLNAWGGLPHLVRDGAATVRLALAEPGAYQVWALTTSGKRTAEIPATVDGGSLVIPLRVRGAEGARLLYEVVRR